MNKGLKKRSLIIHGHSTSIALEAEFWQVIDEILAVKNLSLAQFIALIDDERMASNSPHGLAASLRLYALKWAREV